MDREVRLIQGVAHGNERDFEELFRRYRPRLGSFFLQRTRDPHVADELIQETMMVVWERAASFEPSARPSSWIFGIGYRKFLEWHRQSSRAGQLYQTEQDPEELPQSRKDEISAQIGRETLSERIRRALSELSQEHRAVVDLTFQEGLSYGEIARILGIQPGTVKSRMFYAKEQLKEILIRQGMKGDELWQISKEM
jgi:RNA polymerase sigma factor (sigma-70 family)